MIAIITGATAGFGKATAEIFAKNGYDIIVTGRRKEKLDTLSVELKSAYKVDVLPLCFDVRKKEEVKNALGSLSGKWANVDVLVNNAGGAHGLDLIQDGNTDDWDTMMDTNVKGLLYVSKEVMPYMIKRNSGHIVNIGSTAGKDVYAKGNVYCASKFAVDALSKSMRIDLLPHKIKVTAIHPGAAETEFSEVRFKGDKDRAKSVYKGFQPLSAQDIAETIWFAVSRPAHVNIADIVITPTAQANVYHILKNE